MGGRTRRRRRRRRHGTRLIAGQGRQVAEREQDRVLVALALHRRDLRRLRRRLGLAGAEQRSVGVGRRGAGLARRARLGRGLLPEQIAAGLILLLGRVGGEDVAGIALAGRRRARLLVVAGPEHRGHGVGAARRLGGRGAAAGDQVGELRHLGQGLPVGEALAPDVRLAVDLAGREPRLDVGHGQRADLLLIDDDVPGRLVGWGAAALVAAVVVDPGLLLIEAAAGRGRRGRRRRGLLGAAGAADDDDVAALLAADLEDLALDLLVGNRVLRRAGVTDDLHGRVPSRHGEGGSRPWNLEPPRGLAKNAITRRRRFASEPT